jgi:membrane fusion protein (multidrug efflux system)
MGVQTAQQQALAEAQRDGARAQLALAKQALQNHTLLAPFAGVVTKAPDGPGTVVTPGVPQFHVSDLSKLKLVGSVTASDAALIKVGAEVAVRSGAANARGTVTALVSALDDKTKRVPVQAEIQNDGSQALIAGSLVRATIQSEQTIDVIRLPHAVLRPGSQDEVLVVADDKLVVKRIEFSIADDGTLLVRKGLTASDVLVATPWAEAKTGDSVQVAP